jgi:tetratricopeptide (TPR) repeat protein
MFLQIFEQGREGLFAGFIVQEKSGWAFNDTQNAGLCPELDYATHCLLKAVDINSSSADAYYYLALVYAVKGRLQNAAKLFAHSLDIRPDDICTLCDSAAVYAAMGRQDDAAKRIEKARALAPDDVRLKKVSRRIRLAQKAEKLEDFLVRFRPHPAHTK